MKYDFTEGLTLLKNKSDWENWDKLLPGRERTNEPEKYPCLACYFTHEGYNGDVTFAQYIYPNDAVQLITEYWEQEDQKQNIILEPVQK